MLFFLLLSPPHQRYSLHFSLGGRYCITRPLISKTTHTPTILSPCYFNLKPKTFNPAEHESVTAEGPQLPCSLCLSRSLCWTWEWLCADGPTVLVSFSQLMWDAGGLGSCGPAAGWAMGNESSTTEALVRASSLALNCWDCFLLNSCCYTYFEVFCAWRTNRN